MTKKEKTLEEKIEEQEQEDKHAEKCMRIEEKRRRETNKYYSYIVDCLGDMTKANSVMAIKLINAYLKEMEKKQLSLSAKEFDALDTNIDLVKIDISNGTFGLKGISKDYFLMVLDNLKIRFELNHNDVFVRYYI